MIHETRILNLTPFQEYVKKTLFTEEYCKQWLFDNNYDIMWYAKSTDVSNPINEGFVYSFYDPEGMFTFCLPDYFDMEEPKMNEQKDFTFEEFIIDLNLYE